MHQPGAWLAACIDSVIRSRRVDVRLVVIDDLPGDPDVAAIVRDHDRVRLIVPSANLGFATAVNLGVMAGDAEYVLLLNQDARLEPDALADQELFMHGQPWDIFARMRSDAPVAWQREGAIGANRRTAGDFGEADRFVELFIRQIVQAPAGILSPISIAQSGKKDHFKYPSVCARS
jgi:glycosyltransferase involved in cell wall biosynthesis